MDRITEVNGYRISPELFSTGPTGGAGPCTCSAVCCQAGVYADIAEREKILAHSDIIRKYMDETQTTETAAWFDREEEDDADFPSGRCVGTAVHGDKCVFLDRENRCTLQVAAVQEGFDRWFLKPLFCILYPVEISGKTICFDDLLQGEQSCCTVSPDYETPLFEACKDELVHLLGEQGFQELREQYAQYRKQSGENR
jgi:hypothetical protein